MQWLAKCFTAILEGAFKCPGDSLVDIANDAFVSHGLPLTAEWTDDDSEPIRVVLHQRTEEENDTQAEIDRLRAALVKIADPKQLPFALVCDLRRIATDVLLPNGEDQ